MILKNLAGLFSGSGFKKNDGRKPLPADTGFIAGPIDIAIDDNGKIREVGQSIQSENRESSFDGEGLVATSGFLDSHTHSLFGGSRASEYFLRWRGESYQSIAAAGGGIHNTVRDTTQAQDLDLIAKTERRLHAMLRCGVTTVETKSGYGGDARHEKKQLQLLKEIRQKSGIPDIKSTFLGLHALPPGRDEASYIDEMISILDEVKNEGLADYVDAFPEKSFFTLEGSLRFARAAKQRGLKVKIHADELSNLESSKSFCEEGALSVDHLQQISEAGIEALVKSRCVATLLPATSFYLNLAYSRSRDLIDRGARVALASDFNPGTAPNSDLGFTLLLAATQLKMSPAEIFCAVTYNAAGALGLDTERGLLEKGMRADIALWPVESSRHALEEIILGTRPSHVFVGGESFSF